MQKLEQKKDFCEHLLNSFNDVVYAFDQQLRYIYWGKNLEKLTGFKSAEVLGKTIAEIFPMSIGNASEQMYHRVLNTGVSETVVSEIRHNGETAFFEITAVSIQEGISVFGKNITEKIKIEQSLKDSEERYRLVTNLISDYVYRLNVDANGQIKMDMATENYTQSTGRLFSEALTPDQWKEIVHPDDAPTFFNLLNEISKKVMKVHFEARFITKKGDWRWVSCVSESIADPITKKITSIVGSVSDITERKKAQEILREAEERFRLTFKTSPDSIVITRLSDGMFVEVNDGFRRNTGYLEEDVLGKTSAEINIWENIEDRDKIVKGLIDKNYYDNLEANFKRKDGSILTGLMSARIIKLNGVPHIVSITRDFTDRKQIEQQILEAKMKAEKADSLKTQFLYNMSHEIRTPMNAICGFADLLSTQSLTLEKQKQYTAIIKNRSNDLLTIIEDILDISKIEVGQLQIKDTTGNINDLLNELYNIWNNLSTHNEITRTFNWKVDCNLAPSQQIISADFVRLRQILNNLISNAFKYSVEGTISFGCFLNEDKMLQFYVKDNGIGIPKEMYGVIFDRFRQLEEGFLNRSAGGTGLGLSIVKGLVLLMNGHIWLESEVGKGSTFYFTIPYNSVNEVKEPNIMKNEMKSKLINKTILLVEDDKNNVILIKAILEAYDFKILVCYSGEECKQLIFEENISVNLILMDIRLPDINGIELTKLIHKKDPGIPVIAQTAYATAADKSECLKAGCVDYISKPMNHDLLIDKIMIYIN